MSLKEELHTHTMNVHTHAHLYSYTHTPIERSVCKMVNRQVVWFGRVPIVNDLISLVNPIGIRIGSCGRLTVWSS